MITKADMMPIRAEPRRKILIVMLSCVFARCFSLFLAVHHQFDNFTFKLNSVQPERAIVEEFEVASSVSTTKRIPSFLRVVQILLSVNDHSWFRNLNALHFQNQLTVFYDRYNYFFKNNFFDVRS